MLRTKNRSTRLGRLFHLLLVISAMSIGLLAQTPEDQLTVVSVSPDAGADHGHHPSRVIVRFRSDPSFLPDSKSNHGLGADNVYVVENPPGLSVAEAVRHYREDPNVLYVEPDYEVNTTADPGAFDNRGWCQSWLPIRTTWARISPTTE
jgi:hypothetical protein